MDKKKEEKKVEVKDDIKPDTKTDLHEAHEVVARANIAAERLEKANLKTEALMEKQQLNQVNEMLGGKAEAAEPQVKEETPQEYAKRVMSNDVETTRP